jgi:hypothetical protein
LETLRGELGDVRGENVTKDQLLTKIEHLQQENAELLHQAGEKATSRRACGWSTPVLGA